MNKLEIINQACKELRIPVITALSELREYPYNCVETLLDEAIISFNQEQHWKWQYETTDLTYTADSNSFNLTDYKVDPNRIAGVYYISGGTIRYLTRKLRQDFKRQYPASSTTGTPLCYSIESNTMYIHQAPDQDYSLKIVHYKPFPVLISATDEITEIPDKYQRPLIDDVKFMLAVLLNKGNSEGYMNDYLYTLSLAVKQNAVKRNGTNIMPSNIRW